MGARAEAVEETRRRILHAQIALAGERPFAETTLETIAERAGVSVQTVLRQFGSRDELFASGVEQAMADIEEERRTPAGDVDAAVRVVVDHYERRGRTALSSPAASCGSASSSGWRRHCSSTCCR